MREQKQSSKFYDDKIDFLIGVTDKTNNKINEKNLLNFYLSSITVTDFKFEPTKKTKPEIWKYLNAANLIKLEDASDKDKLKELEIAANNGQLDKKKIFEIYKQIPFNLNTLINAKNNYKTLNESDARALIYQKYLLSEASESKIQYLFLLEELFKKADFINIYSKYLNYNFVSSTRVNAHQAKSWNAPNIENSEMIYMSPEGSNDFFFRFVEQNIDSSYVPFGTYGWNAAELIVRDVDKSATRIMDSPFEIIGEPADLSFTDQIRAMQIMGPSKEVLYLFQK